MSAAFWIGILIGLWIGAGLGIASIALLSRGRKIPR